MASIIEEFSHDLDGLAELLGQWMRASLDHEQQANEHNLRFQKLKSQLEESQRRLSQQGDDWEAEVQQQVHRRGEWRQQIHEQGQGMLRFGSALDSRIQACRQQLVEQLQHLHEQLNQGKDSLHRGATAMQEGFVRAEQSREGYQAQTEQHFSRSQEFLGQSRQAIGQRLGRIQASAGETRATMVRFGGHLSERLQGDLRPRSQQFAQWHQDDWLRAREHELQQRLASTLEHLGGYRSKTEGLAGEVEALGSAVVQLSQRLAQEFPETVRQEAVVPLTNLAQDLCVHYLVKTLGEVLAGAGISAACVGAMPVLKVVSASLKLLLNITSLAQTGQLMADRPEDYEEVASESIAASQATSGQTLQADFRVVDFVDAAVGQLDSALQQVEREGTQAVDRLREVAVEQGARLEQFVRELFCPICGAQCETADGH